MGFIGVNVFSHCSKLTQIEIPAQITEFVQLFESACLTSFTLSKNVKSIKQWCFASCGMLSSFTIPEDSALETIGDGTFCRCSRLTSFWFPPKLNAIQGTFVFSGCSSLSVLDCSPLNPKFFASENILYRENELAMMAPALKCTNFTVPENVTSISNIGFNNMIVERIIISRSVAVMGSYAFKGASKLSRIEVDSDNEYFTSENGILFNKKKTEIIRAPPLGDIQEFVVSYNVTNVCTSAFERASKLVNVTFLEPPNTDGTSQVIGEYTFSLCPQLKYVTLSSSVASIGKRAFFYSTELVSVYLPENMRCTSFQGEIFYGCGKLISAPIPKKVTSISYSCYHSCGIESITIWKTVKSLGSVFPNCSKLVNVTFEEGSQVTILSDNLFQSCTSLKTVQFPENLQTIGKNCFLDCWSLSSETVSNLPRTVTEIQTKAFSGCLSLDLLSLGAATIGPRVFDGCSNLQSVVIESSVASIDEDSFYICASLKTIDVSSSNDAFASVSGILYNKGRSELRLFPCKITATEFTVPSTVTRISRFAFYGCKNLVCVNLVTVTSIGTSAFDQCVNLQCGGLVYSVSVSDMVKSGAPERALYPCSPTTEFTVPNARIDFFSECIFHFAYPLILP